MAALIPFDPWVSGTNQNSIPANDNAMRAEVLAAGVIADDVTAQPGSPADGDLYIIPSGATGTQWATFAEDSLAYYMDGTWYEFTPYENLLKVVDGVVKIYDGADWVEYGGGGGGSGGPLEVQENGVTVSSDVTVIDFTGSDASVTEVSPGVVEVVIPSAGGGGGGGGGGINPKWRGFVYPQPNSSTLSSFGFAAPAVTGTPAGGTISSATKWQSYPRVNYGVGAATNAVAGNREPSGQFASRFAGFKMRYRMGPSTGATASTHRFFLGLRNVFGAPTDVNPSTYTDIIGLGYDAADTQVQIMHNDGSGTATKVALGGSFPKPSTADSAIYDLVLECAPGSGTVSYTVTEVIGGATASGTITTDLPASTTLMLWWSQMSAGGTSTAITITFFGLDFEVGV